jgi:hypothetical protein
MDLNKIIGALIEERNRIDRIIRSIEGGGTARRPGRKSMDEDARRAVSERMKRYWAKRRQNSATTGESAKGGTTGPKARAAGAGSWDSTAGHAAPPSDSSWSPTNFLV